MNLYYLCLSIVFFGAHLFTKIVSPEKFKDYTAQEIYEMTPDSVLRGKLDTTLMWISQNYKNTSVIDTLYSGAKLPLRQGIKSYKLMWENQLLGYVNFEKTGRKTGEWTLDLALSPSTAEIARGYTIRKYYDAEKEEYMVYPFRDASRMRFTEYLKEKDRLHYAIKNYYENIDKIAPPWQIPLCQGPTESGYGTSRLAVLGNNEFGIKCFVHSRKEHKRMLRKGIKVGPSCINAHDDHKYDYFRRWENPLGGLQYHADILMGRTSSKDRYDWFNFLPFDDHFTTMRLEIHGKHPHKGSRKDVYWYGELLEHGKDYTFSNKEWWFIGLCASGYATSPYYAQKVANAYYGYFSYYELLYGVTEADLEYKYYINTLVQNPIASN